MVGSMQPEIPQHCAIRSTAMWRPQTRPSVPNVETAECKNGWPTVWNVGGQDKIRPQVAPLRLRDTQCSRCASLEEACHSSTCVVSSRVIIAHMMWTRRLLESQVTVTDSNRLDSFSGQFCVLQCSRSSTLPSSRSTLQSLGMQERGAQLWVHLERRTSCDGLKASNASSSHVLPRKSEHGHRQWETSFETRQARHRQRFCPPQSFRIVTEFAFVDRVFANVRLKLPEDHIYTNEAIW